MHTRKPRALIFLMLIYYGLLARSSQDTENFLYNNKVEFLSSIDPLRGDVRWLLTFVDTNGKRSFALATLGYNNYIKSSQGENGSLGVVLIKNSHETILWCPIDSIVVRKIIIEPDFTLETFEIGVVIQKEYFPLCLEPVFDAQNKNDIWFYTTSQRQQRYRSFPEQAIVPIGYRPYRLLKVAGLWAFNDLEFASPQFTDRGLQKLKELERQFQMIATSIKTIDNYYTDSLGDSISVFPFVLVRSQNVTENSQKVTSIRYGDGSFGSTNQGEEYPVVQGSICELENTAHWFLRKEKLILYDNISKSDRFFQGRIGPNVTVENCPWPQSPQSEYSGDSLVQQARYVEAIEAYDQALLSYSDHDSSALRLKRKIGQAYCALGTFFDANVYFFPLCSLLDRGSRSSVAWYANQLDLALSFLKNGPALAEKELDTCVMRIENSTLLPVEKRTVDFVAHALKASMNVSSPSYARYELNRAFSAYDSAILTSASALREYGAIGLFYAGETCRKIGDDELALTYLKKAQSFFAAQKMRNYEYLTSDAIGVVYDENNALDSALFWLHESARLAEKYWFPLFPILQRMYGIRLLSYPTIEYDSLVSRNFRVTTDYMFYALLHDHSIASTDTLSTHFLARLCNNKKFSEGLNFSENFDGILLKSLWYAICSEKQGDRTSALRFYKHAVDLIELRRDFIGSESGLRSRFFEGRTGPLPYSFPYEQLSLLYHGSGKDYSSFMYAELTKGRIAFERIEKRRNPDYNPKLGRNRAEDTTMAGEPVERTLDAMIRTRNAFFDSLGATHQPALNFSQQLTIKKLRLRSNEFCISYRVTEKKLLIYRISEKGIDTTISVDFSKNLLRMIVSGYVKKISAPPAVATEANRDYIGGAILYGILLKDVLTGIPEDADVHIIPDDILSFLPFEALPCTYPLKSSNSDSISFVGEHRVFSYW